jgi:GNAT superfamily N-acetyltransferase
MSRPRDNATTEAVVKAFFETMTLLTSTLPGAYLRNGDGGTKLVFTNVPIPTLNVVAVDHEPDLGEVEAFARELSGNGLPWSIQVRGDAGPELRQLAGRHGLTAADTLPPRVWDAESPLPPAGVPDGTEVRTVSAAESGLFAAALAEGFGMPREIADVFSLPELLGSEGATAFVLERDGEAVATGFNVLIGGHVGLFNGSVPPRHRGNGYYRALVTARLRHAVAAGARHAYTQNTPMSQPLYESLGFRPAETWTYLTAE